MSSNRRRKAYSTSFRRDWVLPSNSHVSNQYPQTPLNIDSPAASAKRSGISQAKTFADRSTSSHDDSTMKTAERMTLASAKTFSERPRTNLRYSYFYAQEWTVGSLTDERISPSNSASIPLQALNVSTPSTSKIDVPRTKKSSITSSILRPQNTPPVQVPGSKVIPSITQRIPLLQSPPIKRPPSSPSGYDAPPKPPPLEPSYTLMGTC